MKTNAFLIGLSALALICMLAGCPGTGSETDSGSDPVAVTGVNLSSSLTLYNVASPAGKTRKLTATVIPADAANKAVTWKSSDESKVTVTADGTVTAKANGTATITVTTADGGFQKTCAVTVSDPISINNLDGLKAISSNAANMSKSYKLMADISDPVTKSIGFLDTNGNIVSFTGDFDGNGKTITLGITNTGGVAFSMGEYNMTTAGLFAVIGDMEGSPGSSGTVHDLKVAGTVNITNNENKTKSVGGVTGALGPSAEISKVVSSVDITLSSSGTGDLLAGGILGSIGGGRVINTYATGAISGTSTNTNSEINVDIGGIVGAGGAGELSRVYSTGNVSATSAGKNAQAGGIIGAADTDGTAVCNVNNAYATGNISATASNYARATAGGIAGNSDGGSVSYAYATGTIAVVGNSSGRGAQAGGVMGNMTSASVTNLVALNTTVGITGSNSDQSVRRVVGRNNGGTITNAYGNDALTPTVTQGLYTADKATNKGDGADIAVTVGGQTYSAPDQTWWTNTGFSGSNWTTVWEWDGGTGLPKLRGMLP